MTTTTYIPAIDIRTHDVLLTAAPTNPALITATTVESVWSDDRFVYAHGQTNGSDTSWRFSAYQLLTVLQTA